MTRSVQRSSESTVGLDLRYGPEYEDRVRALAASLAEYDGLLVEGTAPLDDSDDNTPADVRLVATDTPPDDLKEVRKDRPVVWLTAAADTVTAAYEFGALDVLLVPPESDSKPVAAKVAAAITRWQTARDDPQPPANALAHVDDGVFTLDDSFRLTYLNDAAASVLGADRESLLGETVWSFLPDDAVAQLRGPLQQARAERSTTSLEVSFPRGGRTRWYEVDAEPHGDGLAVYVRNVTDSKEGESQDQQYEHLVRTVGDAVYLLDERGRFTFVNDALCEMTGYDRSELLGSSVHIIKDDGTVQEAKDTLRDLKRRRREGESTPIAELEVELVRKDGERIPCTDRMTLRATEPDEEFRGTVGTLRDISTQRRRENILGGLLDATRQMVNANGPEEIAERVVQTAVGVLETDSAGVRKYDPDTERLVSVATTGTIAAADESRAPYDVGEGPVGTVFEEQRPMVVDDFADIDDDRDRGGAKVGAYFPLGEDRTLSLGRAGERGFTEDELQFLEVLVTIAGAVFKRVDRQRELRRYEAAVEAAEDLLFTVDGAGQFTLASRALSTLLGVQREELVGMDVAEFLPESGLADSLSSPPNGTVTHETELRTVGGEAVPCRLTVSPVGTGAAGEAVVTVQDISELQSARSEATQQRRRFVELFRTLSDPVVDIEYVQQRPEVRSVNRSFATLVGAEPEALRDTPLEAVLERLPTELADPLTAMEQPRAIETEVSTSDGASRRHFILRTVPYEGDDADRAFVILTDVTDVKQRETHLNVLHRVLRHNVRNETSVIGGFAEQLQEMDTDDDVKRYAEYIEDASDTLIDASETARRIQQVLQADRLDPHPRPVEELAADIERLVEREYPEATVSVTTETTGTALASDRLLRAVEELVENAVEHNPADTTTVEIRLSTDATGERVTLSVADDGPGIPESEWAILAGERERTQLQHTSGLGLWLVKWVVGDHGGNLSLDAADEEGTTITLTLPRTRSGE
jgi:PAS domain S-box-containing protein